MADSEKLTNTINEAGLSKIKQAISDPESSFAVICASRNDLSDEENTERFKALVQDLGTYGYIKLRGGYIEKTATGEEIPVVEKSVLVKYLPYEHAIELGKKYGQESISGKTKMV